MGRVKKSLTPPSISIFSSTVIFVEDRVDTVFNIGLLRRGLRQTAVHYQEEQTAIR